MWDNVENMSSKKYDANIGTTRHARAIQQAVELLLIPVLFLFRVILLNVWQFQPETFLPVFNLEQQAQYESHDSE